MIFKIHSKYSPSGAQPNAIKLGLLMVKKEQVLLGAPETGKKFTIANVIKEINRPNLVLEHNKILAWQLYSEFKALFLDNYIYCL